MSGSYLKIRKPRHYRNLKKTETMRRKDFIRQVGKGIAFSALLPVYPVLSPLRAQKNDTGPKAVSDDDIYRPEGYHLIWEDHFDGATLDESEWFYRMDLKRSSVQKKENVKVENGHLVLAMRKEDCLGLQYTGAGIVSKRRWQHGYYEIKAKVTNAAGWHHAFWAQQGNGFLTYCFDRMMEIDVMEMEATTGSNHNLWIYPDGWNSKQKKWNSIPNQDLGFDASRDFHVYGYEYSPDGIKFYVDGTLRHSINATEDDHKHYSLNLWLTVIATHTDAEPDLPAYDYIDYVRCYSRNPHASLPVKVEAAYERGPVIYIDSYDGWGFNMGDYWEISSEGNYYGRNYYKWKRKETYNEYTDWALFRPFISDEGNYDIYLRWVAGTDRSSEVPLEIWYDGGKKCDKTKTINQQQQGEQWVKIGNYHFAHGWNNLIKLIARNPGYVIADAAKFVRTS